MQWKNCEQTDPKLDYTNNTFMSLLNKNLNKLLLFIMPVYFKLLKFNAAKQFSLF